MANSNNFLKIKQDEVLWGSQEGRTDIKIPHYSILQYDTIVYRNALDRAKNENSLTMKRKSRI